MENAALGPIPDPERLREAFDPDAASRGDIWRYAPLLPVAADPVTLGEGWTDLVAAGRLGDALGVELSLKLEGGNPTGSTKDRGSSVLVTHAREEGADAVACASTGNAAASAAGYAARGGLECALFVPDGLPDAKAVQPLVYGADVVRVDGSYADAHDRCRERAREEGWLDRSAGATPYVPAGMRTLGYELAEQCSDAPEWVAVSMGNGGTLAAVWRGWQTFADLGYVERVPRFLGVQSASASAIHDAYHGTDGGSEGPETCADSIAVEEPHRARAARRAIEQSGGTTVTVTDDALRAALWQLGRHEGVFAEPASAATVAGIDAALDRGVVEAGERVVAVLTGDGLKDPETAYDSVAVPDG